MKTKKTAIILNGSPRLKGNTAVLIKWFEGSLVKNKYTYKKFDLYKMNFKGCVHCDACRKIFNKHGCILKDQFIEVLNEIVKADTIIVASPVYCWSVSGCMSAALDRFYSLFKYPDHKSLLANKNIIGVFTSGGDHFDGMDLCVEMLKRLCDLGSANYVGTIAAANCDKPKDLVKRIDWVSSINNMLMQL